MAAIRTAYTPPLSLWNLVEQHVEPHEQDELKDMLGWSLVEQSLELHAEIDMLLEIWRDVKEETDDSSREQSTLPEPPNQRDRLVQEICFFVDNVKEQAKRKGVDPEHILKKHNSDVLDYAADKTRPDSARSRTSRSSDGRETPMAALSPERLDLAYNMTDQVEAVNKQLNFLDFDKVCHSLRSYLEKEVDQLLEDVQFLQTCLDEAADVRDCPTPALISREPTLTELREERSLLEKELFATEKISSTPAVLKPMFTTSNRVLPQTPPTPTGRRSPSSPAAAWTNCTTPGPVKAKHGVFGVSTDSHTSVRSDMAREGRGKTSHDLSTDLSYRASQDDSSLDLSCVSHRSFPTLEEEIFGISISGSSRQDQDLQNIDRNSDIDDVTSKKQQDHLYLLHSGQGNCNQYRDSYDKTLQVHSKSGSCLEKEKSSLKTILPTPPSFPAPSQTSMPSATLAAAQPFHSDSDLTYQPASPSLRPGTITRGQGHVRRRAVSPRPRVRVVDVTNLVEAHAGKGDSDIPSHATERVINFSSSSSSTSPYTSPPSTDSISVSPSPPASVAEREHRIRPGSANRFREMVLGCRDRE